MSWSNINLARADAAAGVFIALTRRCPLHCPHCSTESTMQSEQASDEYYRSFVGSFTEDCKPRIAWFTGGEPLLRPSLVRELAEHCQSLGITTVITTGLYFGSRGTVPPNIMKALRSIDYVTVSVDRWHELEVSRSNSFSCFDQMLGSGMKVGLQVTVNDPGDPYLRDLRADLSRRFGSSIEIFVSILGPAGRGGNLVGPPPVHDERTEQGVPRPQGCGGLSWPVFGMGGMSANSCCNQEAVNLRAEHLRLPTNWPGIVQTMKEDPVLRVLNILGPRVLAQELGLPDQDPALPYCNKCHTLAGVPGLDEKASQIVSRDAWPVYEAVTSDMRARIGDPTLSIPELEQYSHGSRL